MNRFTAIACGALCLAAGAASAQSAAPTTGTTPPAPRTDLDAKSGTLSDKLKDTGGVIAPTGDVDPAMHKPAPQTGTMPVIKPGTGTGKGGLY